MTNQNPDEFVRMRGAEPSARKLVVRYVGKVSALGHTPDGVYTRGTLKGIATPIPGHETMDLRVPDSPLLKSVTGYRVSMPAGATDVVIQLNGTEVLRIPLGATMSIKSQKRPVV